MANNTDQIRQLVNNVELSGYLAELTDYKEGTTSSNGVPYVSFNGAIQCGETPDMTVKFRTFVKSKKADGTDSKIFAKVKKWATSAIPLTSATADKPATKVRLVGSVTDNPYVNPNTGKLVESTRFNMQLIDDFKEFKAQVDIEGYIQGYSEELRGEEKASTGRYRLNLLSRDFFRNTLEIKNIVVPGEMYEALQDADYEKGRTATFFIDLIPNIGAEKPVKKKGAVGKQREISGRTYLEWVVSGADDLYEPDDEKALTPHQVKALQVERVNQLTKAQNDYENQSSSKAVGSATAKRDAFAAAMTDDDIPF